ncbi:serine hydrolase domain-containing protein [Nocardiopsis potens]|uniref:serine hydrolase domain-containing protein n=1 Tax=Nocardiopsis potens TaxID=1246458 RepID=UPI00034B7A9B|nr:serine hydrolase domain-containing protein [Nocardiopsis potens]
MTADRTAPRGEPEGPGRAHRPALRALGAAGAVLALVGGCGTAMPGTSPAPPVPAPGGTAEPTEEDVGAWLDGLLPASLEAAGIAGAAVAVVRDGEILTARGYGRADTGTGYEYGETAAGDITAEPVDPDRTLFRMGSVTKVFTATAVMQLVEAGELDLDADIGEYLDFPLETSFDEPVTLRHLLTHTAGFEEAVAGMMLPEGAEPDLRAHLSTDPPEQVYEPGTVPAYSNYGYTLAGYIVERASGTPYAEYIDENVLAPIGMDDSSARQPLPEDLEPLLSQGYETDDGRPQDFETVTGAPAGGLSATATDMARFMLAHLDPERSGGPSLLEPETRELMQAPALDEETLGGLAEGPRMTLGLFEEDRNGRRIVGHGGDTNFFHTHMQLYPEEGTGVFVAFNSTGKDGAATVGLREAVMSGFADRYFPAGEGDREAPPPKDEGRAEEMAGTYVPSRSMHSNFLRTVDLAQETRVAARPDGTILVSPGPETGAPTAYEEIEPWVWREVGGRRILTARVEDGRVDALGYASAFSLLPADPERSSAVALPVLAASTGLLLLVVLSWPVGAVLRRRLRPPGRERAGRAARAATRAAVGATLAAFAGWAAVIGMAMSLQEVSPLLLRALQVAQAAGMAGTVPAALVLFGDVRRKAGWARCPGGALVLAALVGCGWFAVSFNLVAPDISY